MTAYTFPPRPERPAVAPATIYTVASGDLRPTANVECWPEQLKLEENFGAAVRSAGWNVLRGHSFDDAKGHGFIAVDALVTNRLWRAMGLDPATTLHDVRWGDDYQGEFVWVFEISGSAPAAHYGGYDKAYSMRQPPMYFPLGGGTLSGVSRPGEIVWSRVFVMGGEVHADLGRGRAVEVPEEETRRRLDATTPQWPIMHAVLDGVSRDQFMARHKANHVQVAYVTDAATADKALTAKAAFFAGLGVRSHLCGEPGAGRPNRTR